jgi:peptide/nickel transport system permease protein
MGRLILRRSFWAIPTLFGVTVMTFILTNLLPGDPARALAGRYATAEQIQVTRERLGLNQPIYVQYVRHIGRYLQGDLGTSFHSRQEVSKELVTHVPPTVELAFAAMFIAIVIGIPLGIISGASRSRWLNSGLILLSVAGVGIPVFWAGLVFQLIFYGELGILPLSGRLSPEVVRPPAVFHMYTIDSLLAGQWDTFGDAVWHLILPAFTLALSRVASLTRITNAGMVEAMRKDFVRTARAKGLTERIVVVRHVLKNALLPTVTNVSMQLGWLIGGAVLVEVIFTWGGIGSYAWNAILKLDIPVIMGITLVTTFAFLILNLLADIGYGLLDPRITYD